MVVNFAAQIEFPDTPLRTGKKEPEIVSKSLRLPECELAGNAALQRTQDGVLDSNLWKAGEWGEACAPALLQCES